jgi:hypothetical protein
LGERIENLETKKQASHLTNNTGKMTLFDQIPQIVPETGTTKITLRQHEHVKQFRFSFNYQSRMNHTTYTRD